MSSNIQVALADPQFLTRKGLADLIRSTEGFDLVTETHDPFRLSDHSEDMSKSILVIGISGNDSNLVRLLEQLNNCINIEILVITNSTDSKMINNLLKKGIKGMVTKNCSEDEIQTALRSVAIGNRFYCNSVLNMIMDSDKRERSGKPNLTNRENEVLSLIAEGKSTTEIAEKLHISIHTVNSHRKNIIKKLKINSPLHLVAYAVETGLVSIDFPN
jgi:DNA-binding NarL/FixJ family response regulator